MCALTKKALKTKPFHVAATGVTASAIAASLKLWRKSSFYVNTAGGRLFVSFTRTDNTFKKRETYRACQTGIRGHN